jgi:hypothetical protein
MANSARGSVALQAGENEYKISFSVNALCELEEAFDVNVQQIGAIFEQDASVRDVRKLARCALSDHHPDLSEKDAGRVVSEAGIPAFMAAVQKAFQLAFPEAKGGENPPQAKASDR